MNGNQIVPTNFEVRGYSIGASCVGYGLHNGNNDGCDDRYGDDDDDVRDKKETT